MIRNDLRSAHAPPLTAAAWSGPRSRVATCRASTEPAVEGRLRLASAKDYPFMLTLSEYGSFPSPRNEPPRSKLDRGLRIPNTINRRSQPSTDSTRIVSSSREIRTFSNSLRMLLSSLWHAQSGALKLGQF